MQTHKVYLTPLTPIHIGCGEDFEPMNYVIEPSENLLYGFEPNQISLTNEQKQQLLGYIENNPAKQLGNIYAFFARNEDLVKQIKEKSLYVVDVSKELVNEWQSKLGKTVQIEPDSEVFNKLAIERHAYNPINKQAYIPGSSVKGSLTTVILNAFEPQNDLTDKELHSDNLSELLREKYFGKVTDQNRKAKLLSQCLKVSDFVPVSQAFTKVFYANNYPKISDLKEKNKGVRGFNIRREAILGGQYRVYQADFTLLEEKFNIKDLFKKIRDFYIPIFEKESEIQIKKGLLEEKHFNNIKKILNNENIALIRLGKSGAEDKVFNDNSLRKIEVKLKKKDAKLLGTATEPKTASTTYWLAGDKDGQTENVLPFGWAILEYQNLEQDNETLKAWCNSIPKTKQQTEIGAIEREKQKKQAEQAKEKMLNSLPENQRKVIELEDKFNASNEKQIDSSSALLKEVRTLIENDAINWNKEDKQFMAEHITKELILKRVELKKKNADNDLDKLLKKLVAE